MAEAVMKTHLDQQTQIAILYASERHPRKKRRIRRLILEHKLSERFWFHLVMFKEPFYMPTQGEMWWEEKQERFKAWLYRMVFFWRQL